MTTETVLRIAMVIFCVANLMAVGLECNLKEGLKALRNPRLIFLTLFWGWVIGPVVAYQIISLFPLSEGHAAGLVLVSLVPVASFLPLSVSKARADMPFTWAYVLLATVVTVVLLPFMAPLIVKGVALKPWSLARPLLALVLLPLVAGFMIRSYAVPVAHKLLPVAKWIGVIVLLVILAFALTLYRQELLGAVGSFAPGALALILILMAVFPYVFSPGLQQNQRSVMAMGMSSRNISAGMAALFGITNPPVGMFMMVVLMVPVNLVFMFICARVFAKLAGKTDAGAGA